MSEFGIRHAKAKQDAEIIIGQRFEEAQRIHAGLKDAIAKPGLGNPVHLAAKLWHLWGFTDGLLYGLTDQLLSPLEAGAVREKWRAMCDKEFGSDLFAVLGDDRCKSK